MRTSKSRHLCNPSRQPGGMATSYSTLRGVEKSVGPKIIRLKKGVLARVLDEYPVSETLEEDEVTVIVSLPLEVYEETRRTEGGQRQQRWSKATTEQELRSVDQDVHAFRTVGPLLAAGQPFVIFKPTKGLCVADFERLLGNFWDPAFPVKGGRQYIAEILCRMLGRHVTLVDMKRWFFAPTSQQLDIHQELLSMLNEKGLTWPPNAHAFPGSSYRLSTGKKACQPSWTSSHRDTSGGEGTASTAKFVDDACKSIMSLPQSPPSAETMYENSWEERVPNEQCTTPCSDLVSTWFGLDNMMAVPDYWLLPTPADAAY